LQILLGVCYQSLTLVKCGHADLRIFLDLKMTKKKKKKKMTKPNYKPNNGPNSNPNTKQTLSP